MKKFLVLLCLVSLFGTPIRAFYPAFMNMYGEGIHPNAVMDITHDDVNVYVVKLNGQFVVMNKTTGKEDIFDVKVGSLSYTPWSIAVNSGKIWIGTAEGKLLTFSDGKFHQSGISLSWQYDEPLGVENILFDAQGNMYLSCHFGVGFRVSTINNVERFTIHPKGIGSFSVNMCLGQNNTLWVCNYGNHSRYGLTKYTREKGSIYYFKDRTDIPYGLVTGFTIDKEDGIWCLVKSKLIRLLNDEVSESYDFPDICYAMQFDEQQRLWMARQHGPMVMMKDGAFTDYPCPIESKRWMCMDIDGDDIYIGTDEFLLLFRDGEYTKIDLGQPDPQGHQSTGINHTEVSTSTFGIFDLLGRQLQDKPERGVYIQDGRKYVVR